MWRSVLCIPAILVAVSSCSEPYDPEDLVSSKSVLIIQGNITENMAPWVRIAWAIPYEQEVAPYISGAEVFITDGDSAILPLDEIYDGMYTSSVHTGIRGRTYTLHVILPDKSEYISSPQKILPPPEIDSLYAVPGINISYRYDTEGEPEKEENKGLYLFADLSSSSPERSYFKFQTKVLKESFYYKYWKTRAQYMVYMWDIALPDGAHSVDYTMTHNGRELLTGYEPGFLHYNTIPGDELSFLSPTYIQCWIITFKVYSVNQDVYDYYNSLKNQLEFENQIFSPIPYQIRSNIKCITDSRSPVSGIFEATSYTTVYKIFDWSTITSYRSMELDSFPDVVSAGTSAKLAPKFWINY